MVRYLCVFCTCSSFLIGCVSDPSVRLLSDTKPVHARRRIAQWVRIIKRILLHCKERHLPWWRCCIFLWLVTSANPSGRSGRRRLKNKPKRHWRLLGKLDYCNKKITLQTTPTSTVQNYHNASQHVVINCFLPFSYINRFTGFVSANEKKSLLGKLGGRQREQFYSTFHRRLNTFVLSAAKYDSVLNKQGGVVFNVAQVLLISAGPSRNDVTRGLRRRRWVDCLEAKVE